MNSKFYIKAMVFILMSHPAFSQDTSLRPSEEKSQATNENVQEAENGRMLIIPFEPKLYASDIDREVAVKNNLSFREIRGRFRQSLSGSIYAEALHGHQPVSMLSEDPEIIKDLNYIYMSIGYQYKEMPLQEIPEEKPGALQALVNKAKKATEPKTAETGSKLENGQIVSHANSTERYMHTKIINPNMLDYLSNKYEADFFLFVNQMDIKIAPGTDYRALEAENYQREFKVHYTVMDRFGNSIYGGVAKSRFSSRENNIDKIIKSNFPVLSQQISANFPAPEITRAAKDKRDDEKKKARKQERDLMEQY